MVPSVVRRSGSVPWCCRCAIQWEPRHVRLGLHAVDEGVEQADGGARVLGAAAEERKSSVAGATFSLEWHLSFRHQGAAHAVP